MVLGNIFSNFKIPLLSSMKIVCDMGTSCTRMGIIGKGIVLREPSYIGYSMRAKEALFYGEEAKKIVGKTPEFIKIYKPVVNGIISDFDMEVMLVRKFIELAVHPYYKQYRILKPTIKAVAAYPLIATEIERKAVEEVLSKAGCSEVELLEKPMATARGCGIKTHSHKPEMVIDMGAGLVEISIISGGGIVVNRTLKYGGETMDKSIANYLYLKHGLILGEKTIEQLKINLLNFETDEKLSMVRGKSLENGLPKSVKIRTGEVKEAVLGNINQIIEAAKELLETSPPEVVDEIFEEGIKLAGGLSQIKGIDKFMSGELKIKIQIAANASDATIYGLLSEKKE